MITKEKVRALQDLYNAYQGHKNTQHLLNTGKLSVETPVVRCQTPNNTYAALPRVPPQLVLDFQVRWIKEDTELKLRTIRERIYALGGEVPQ